MRSHPISRATLGIELRGPLDIVLLERPTVSFGDPMTPHVPEDRGPVDAKRYRQALHRDAHEVGGNQLGDLVRSQATLDGESVDHPVGRVDKGRSGTLP